jgi:hypothetical protein
MWREQELLLPGARLCHPGRQSTEITKEIIKATNGNR